MSKRVLVSRGYGAGWSTWADDGKAKAIAEYEPIIEYLEAGKPVVLDAAKRFGAEDAEWLHPDFVALVEQMKQDLDLDDYFYTGGADGLTVETVSGPYMIEEYDGSESIRTSKDFWT